MFEKCLNVFERVFEKCLSVPRGVVGVREWSECRSDRSAMAWLTGLESVWKVFEREHLHECGH